MQSLDPNTLFLPDRSHEAQTLAGERPDEPLFFAVVPTGTRAALSRVLSADSEKNDRSTLR